MRQQKTLLTRRSTGFWVDVENRIRAAHLTIVREVDRNPRLSRVGGEGVPMESGSAGRCQLDANTGGL